VLIRYFCVGPFTGKQLALGGLGGLALAAYTYLHTHSYDLPRELGFIFRVLPVARTVRSKADIHWTIADLFDELVARHGDKEGLVFVDDGSEGTLITKRIPVLWSTDFL
jgi:hypothetical protein